MKPQPFVRIPSMVKTALQETADCLGAVEFDTVVAAASWAFCTQSEATRRYIVADFWFRGPPNPAPQGPIAGTRASSVTSILWEPAAMPPSTAALLNRTRTGHEGQKRAFSRTQEFVAGLHWFTTLPIERRVELVDEFTTHPVAQDRLKADTPGDARFLLDPSQTVTGVF
jgi:hypothetical protein